MFEKLASLGVHLPVIQAPMAGGATTPDLVSAVSNAGALGFLAAAILSPKDIALHTAAIRALTDRPFGINLFILPDHTVGDVVEINQAWDQTKPYRSAVGLPDDLQPPTKYAEVFSEQLAALIVAKPVVASFTFGILSSEQMHRLKAAGIAVVGTATHLEEALAWEALGADAVCVQGFEAGGHRGTFLAPSSSLLAGTTFIDPQLQAATGLFALLPQVVDSVKIPVIAAGGIMDGRGIAAALALGATAVQMGTAFLSTKQSAISAEWKQSLHTAKATETCLTRAFSGRYARGLRNQFIADFEAIQSDLPAYPIQNALTGGLRKQAAAVGNVQLLSLWAGQAASQLRRREFEIDAASLVADLVSETQSAIESLNPWVSKLQKPVLHHGE
jgi:nitronate monooxygenase